MTCTLPAGARDPRHRAPALVGEHPGVRPVTRLGRRARGAYPQAARFLEAAIVAGLNVTGAGGTEAGRAQVARAPLRADSLER